MSKPDEITPAQARRLAWWQEARFGMFIHWGLYSATNLDCWSMHEMGIPTAEYIARFEPKFTGSKFDADALMARAKSAGFKYVVMGSRHHEGYCLWDTDTTGFSSARMTPRRDFIAEYVQAARKHGLRFGFYYSLLDWRMPAYWNGPRKDPEAWARYVEYVHAQVRELMTRYGKIDILWYDGAWAPGFMSKEYWGLAPGKDGSWHGPQMAKAWGAECLNAEVRRLQPHILINNRSWPPEDFGTPESALTPEARPWEMCDAMGDFWGSSTADLNRRTARYLVTLLISCVQAGGNFLLNIGPRPDGTLQPWQGRVLDRIGRWMGKYGESIYGCGAEGRLPFSLRLDPWKATRKGNWLYLHLLRYPGSSFGIANYHPYHLESARMLGTGRKLRIRREPTRDVISGLPARTPDDIAEVLKIKVRAKTSAEIRRRRNIAWPSDEQRALLQR